MKGATPRDGFTSPGRLYCDNGTGRARTDCQEDGRAVEGGSSTPVRRPPGEVPRRAGGVALGAEAGGCLPRLRGWGFEWCRPGPRAVWTLPDLISVGSGRVCLSGFRDRRLVLRNSRKALRATVDRLWIRTFRRSR
jgi:hypothetical protein